MFIINFSGVVAIRVRKYV